MKPWTSPLLLLAATFAAPATAASLDDVAAALKATTSLSADFTQTGADGKVLTGKMILARPGKIRFQYDKAKLLIVGNGKTLTFVDYAVNQVSQWPVKSTPLGILLASEPDLSGVARIAQTTDKGIIVEARDAKRPEFGSLAIMFRNDAKAPGGLSCSPCRRGAPGRGVGRSPSAGGMESGARVVTWNSSGASRTRPSDRVVFGPQAASVSAAAAARTGVWRILMAPP
jgi:hypothetical protein